jgi:hypothetical protein
VLCRFARFDERYRAYPIHLYYFGASSLRAMLERHGARVVATESYGLGIDERFRAASGETEPMRRAHRWPLDGREPPGAARRAA